MFASQNRKRPCLIATSGSFLGRFLGMSTDLIGFRRAPVPTASVRIGSLVPRSSVECTLCIAVPIASVSTSRQKPCVSTRGRRAILEAFLALMDLSRSLTHATHHATAVWRRTAPQSCDSGSGPARRAWCRFRLGCPGQERPAWSGRFAGPVWGSVSAIHWTPPLPPRSRPVRAAPPGPVSA